MAIRPIAGVLVLLLLFPPQFVPLRDLDFVANWMPWPLVKFVPWSARTASVTASTERDSDGCLQAWELDAFGRTWYGWVTPPHLTAPIPDIISEDGTFRQVNQTHGVFTPVGNTEKANFTDRRPRKDPNNCLIW